MLTGKKRKSAHDKKLLKTAAAAMGLIGNAQKPLSILTILTLIPEYDLYFLTKVGNYLSY